MGLVAFWATFFLYLFSLRKGSASFTTEDAKNTTINVDLVAGTTTTSPPTAAITTNKTLSPLKPWWKMNVEEVVDASWRRIVMPSYSAALEWLDKGSEEEKLGDKAPSPRYEWRFSALTGIPVFVSLWKMLAGIARVALIWLSKQPVVYLAGGSCLSCIVFGSWTMLRLPILVSISTLLALEFIVYWIVRIIIHSMELLPKVRLLAWWLPVPVPRWQWTGAQARLSRAMKASRSYEEWRVLAEEMDELHGRSRWKALSEDPHYHCRLVRTATQRLRQARTRGHWARVMETLTPCMVKNFGGTMNTDLYAQTHCGTKRSIEALYEEINLALEWLVAATPGSLGLLDDKEARLLPAACPPSQTRTGGGPEDANPTTEVAEIEGEKNISGNSDDDNDAAPELRNRRRRSLRSSSNSSTRRKSERLRKMPSEGAVSSSTTPSLSSSSPSVHIRIDMDLETQLARLRSCALQSGPQSTTKKDQVKAAELALAAWEVFVNERVNFLRKAKRSFGNTALLLSGGATLGLYHLGVMKALVEGDLLPKVVSGTSAGAVLSAFMAVRTDEEIRESFNSRDSKPSGVRGSDSRGTKAPPRTQKKAKNAENGDAEGIKCSFFGLRDWWLQFGPGGPFQGSWFWKLTQIWKKGRIYDYEDFMEQLSWFVGTGHPKIKFRSQDVEDEDNSYAGWCRRFGDGTVGSLENPTFREAFERTGRLVNITCTPFKTSVKGSPPLILNHLTTPHVTLASAACASSCVPMLIEPVPLLEKDPDTGELRPYEVHSPRTQGDANTHLETDTESVSLEHICMRDGTFESDVPVQAISELFNCHFCIVSQVNPHIIPFFYHNRGRDGRPSTWRLWAGGWRGGFVLSALELWLKEDMLKSLRVLAGLDLLIEVFGVNWSYLYLQDSVGDVTLIPDVTFFDYLGLIDNLRLPTELRRKVEKMEKNAWQCFSRIKHRMETQKILDSACNSLGVTSDL